MTKLSTHQTEYQITLQKTLVAELGFLLEVAQGRLPDRKTIQDKLQEKVLSLVASFVGNKVPLADIVVNEVGNYLLEKMKKNEQPALLQSLLTLSHKQLESMADRVAREAACRWDMAINAYLEEKAIQEFAVVGAIRIVEYLRRKTLSITTENLLLGLIAGRSGAGYLKFTNTQLSLKASMSGTIRETTLSAEGLYGRAGYLIGQDFYIPDVILDEEAYKAYRLMKRPKDEGHFGYVKYLKIGSSGGALEGKWPKAGYIQLPEKQMLSPIANKEQDGYEFVVHQPPKPLQDLRKERVTRFVTEKEVHEYLEHISRLDTDIPSFNAYCKSTVFFRGSLKGTAANPLNLSKANFSGSDFSSCTLEHCLLGNCQGLYLTEATLHHVSATGNQLDGAHLDRATVTDSKFTKLTGLQTDWSYATMERCDFKDVLGPGMILEHATIDDDTKKTFGSDLRDTVLALAKKQEEEQKRLTEEIKQNWEHIEEQARKLQVLTSQQQDIKVTVESYGQEIAFLKQQAKPKTYPLLEALKKGSETWGLPRQDNIFIGRKDLLTALHTELKPLDEKTKQEQKTATMTICAGLGGVGKTQLALQFAHHSEHPYTLRIWFPAENLNELQQKILAFAKELGYEEEKPNMETAKRYVQQWLKRNPGWLIVYDNVNTYEEIKPYLPETGGAVLITTRHTLWPEKIKQLPIKEMVVKEAMELIQTLSGKEDKDIPTLAKTLGYLPLAMAQASAYIKRHRLSVSDYLTLYRAHEQRLLADKTLPSGADHLAVAVTWNTSLEAIETAAKTREESTFSRILLTTCAYLASENIPVNLLLTWFKAAYPKLEAQALHFRASLAALEDYSLLTRDSETLTVHRLVQTVMRHQHQALKTASIPYPLLSPEWYKTLLQAIDSEFCLETQAREDDARRQLLLSHLQTLVQHYDTLWPLNTPVEVSRALGNLGHAYRNLGDAKQGKELFERALIIQERHYGKEHIEVTSTLVNLGITYRNLGHPKRAQELYKRALTIRERHYGEGHVAVATTLMNLSIVCRDLGDVKQAQELCERALPILERHYGKEHVQVAIALVNLSNVYRDLRDPKRAQELCERALPIFKRHYGEEHIEVATVLLNLGIAYSDLGDPKRAQELYERAIIIEELHYGKEHVKVAITLESLGNSYSDLGDAKRAKELLGRSLAIKERYYGEGHVAVATTLMNLAIICSKLLDSKQAQILFKRALPIFERHYGEEHVKVGLILYNFARANVDFGNEAEAYKLVQRAFKILLKEYGCENEYTKSAENLLKRISQTSNTTNDHEPKQKLEEYAILSTNTQTDPNIKRCIQDLGGKDLNEKTTMGQKFITFKMVSSLLNKKNRLKLNLDRVFFAKLNDVQIKNLKEVIPGLTVEDGSHQGRTGLLLTFTHLNENRRRIEETIKNHAYNPTRAIKP